MTEKYFSAAPIPLPVMCKSSFPGFRVERDRYNPYITKTLFFFHLRTCDVRFCLHLELLVIGPVGEGDAVCWTAFVINPCPNPSSMSLHHLHTYKLALSIPNVEVSATFSIQYSGICEVGYRRRWLPSTSENTDSFQVSMAHNVPGNRNPPNEITIEYYSKYTDFLTELWRKMTDTDPDLVPVRNDSLGQKEKEWTWVSSWITRSINWNVATDCHACNSAKSVVSLSKVVPAGLFWYPKSRTDLDFFF